MMHQALFIKAAVFIWMNQIFEWIRRKSDVHVFIIIKSIIIFRSNTAPIFFPFYQGGAASKAEVGKLVRKIECTIKTCSFSFFITSSKTHSSYLDLLIEWKGGGAVRNWEFINIRTMQLFLPFLSSLRLGAEYFDKIHEIRPFNTGIPGIVAFE